MPCKTEPAGLVTAFLLAEGLSLEETAGRLACPVARHSERRRQRIAEAQPELAARLGGDR